MLKTGEEDRSELRTYQCSEILTVVKQRKESASLNPSSWFFKRELELAVEGWYYLKVEKKENIDRESEGKTQDLKLVKARNGRCRLRGRFETLKRGYLVFFVKRASKIYPIHLDATCSQASYYLHTVPLTRRDRETIVFRLFRWWTERGRPNDRQLGFFQMLFPKNKHVKRELINMTRAWDKEKIWVLDRNRTHGLPNTELKNSPSLFTYHTDDDFNSADPSIMQGASHIWIQLNDLVPWVFVAQWIEHPPGVREVY